MASKRIIDAKNDDKGRVKEVRFAGNSGFTDRETAIRMADRGQVEGTHVVRRNNAIPHLRTNPDGLERNNLDKLAED